MTFFLTFFLAFYIASILTFFLTFSLAFCLTYVLTFYLAVFLAFFRAFYLKFSEMCLGAGVPHSIRSWQSERRRRRKELHLCQNLETLTWQVGKNSYTYTQLSRGAPPSCKPGTPSNDGSASAKMSAGCVLLEH